jgi:hypothetical protein
MGRMIQPDIFALLVWRGTPAHSRDNANEFAAKRAKGQRMRSPPKKRSIHRTFRRRDQG